MNSTELKTVIDFEKRLTEGQEVRARWTLCNRCITGIGQVKKVNKHSVIVTLSEAVDCEDLGQFVAGQDIKVPLFTTGSGGKLWSCNNRSEPVEGYEVPA